MTLRKILRNTVDLDNDTARYLRGAVLEHVKIPDQWTIDDRGPERNTDPSDLSDDEVPGWMLVFLTHSDTREAASIEILPGSHLLQVCHGDTGEYSEPTYSADAVEEYLQQHHRDETEDGELIT